MTHRGHWHVEYKVGNADFHRDVSDDELVEVLADRYSIENRVTYVGPEVEETNCMNDAIMADWMGKLRK